MGILADLCYKFHAHPEVLATEALAILLGERLLGDALGRYLSTRLALTPPLPVGLTFKTQDSAADGGRPDIVAHTTDGHLCMVIEVKFWAGLTEKQPVAYLERLAGSKPAVLLFVAPGIRHEVLWSELARRLKAAGRVFSNPHVSGFDFRVASVDAVPLVLISWRSLLNVFSDADATLGGTHASDIRQLGDLADRMDTDAFLPLLQDELSPQIGRRLWQFTELLHDVISRLSEATISTKTRKSGGQGYYGASLLIKNHWLYFEVSVWHWSLYSSTPFWLVFTTDRTTWPALSKALAPLSMETPPRLLAGRHGEPPMIPLWIPMGAERDTIVVELFEQIRDIANLLPAGSSPAVEPPAPGATGTPE